MPTLRSSKCETECQNASIVWPESVRPLASVMVADTMTGRRTPCLTKYWSIANRHAFMLRVSKLVSGNSRSTPPATSPSICSL